MGKVKRILPKDETEHFRERTNLQSWSNQNPKMYFREQENGIAFFELKPFDTKRITKRRDDSEFRVLSVEVNSIICRDLVKMTNRLGKGLIENTRSNRRMFEFMIDDYIETVRRLGNFCLECFRAVKLQKAQIQGMDEIFEEETRAEKRERAVIKKSYSSKNKFRGLCFKTRYKFKAISKVSYRVKGNQITYADIFGCNVIKNDDNRIAELNEIADFEHIHFIEQDKKRIFTDKICGCRS